MGKDGGRALSLLLWGLIPSWSRVPQGFINAWAETVAEKPNFREAFRRRRCLIPADGLYEWRKTGNGKQPYYFRLKNEEPFAFAGVWDEWRGEGVVTPSCAIITTRANEVVRGVHDQIPVILREEDYGLWLDGEPGNQSLRSVMLAPYPAAEMESYTVSTLINDPHREGAELVERASIVSA